MAFRYVPKYPLNHDFGSEFQNTPDSIRVGVIIRVDEITLKADVKIITGSTYRIEVELTQGMCGPRSFWGGVPEAGSVVLLGFREISKKNNVQEAVILGYLPVGSRLGLRYDPFATVDPNIVASSDLETVQNLFGKPLRYKRFKMAPGDVGGMSSAGAEMLLNRSVNLMNRAGDLLELRDEERTLVSQTVHRFDSDAGVKRYSGPVRRQMVWWPSDIMTGEEGARQLKSQDDGYFGRDEFQVWGPGTDGAPTKMADADGVLQDIFNNPTQFPPVTYSNGKTVFYPSTLADRTIEGEPEEIGSAYTEYRTEIYHDTELIPEVLTEVDGFTPNPRAPYIEHVMGTVVGNDLTSTMGVRQYGQLLRPQIWSTGRRLGAGKFSLENVARGSNGDLDARTTAAAYLFKINPVESKETDQPFAVAVQKQGKLFVQVPKPSNEPYSDLVKGISAEVNMLGALKMFVGAATPTNTSLYASFEGGIKAEIGRNTDTGNSLDITYTGPVKNNYVGAVDQRGNGLTSVVKGNQQTTVGGDYNLQTQGSINLLANGTVTSKADKIVHQAISGYTLNTAGFQQTVSGLSYLTYAQLKTETISTGGELKTVAAGPVTETIVAGAKTVSVGGALTTTSASTTDTTGAYIQSAASHVITSGATYSVTASAAMTLSASGMLTQMAPSIHLNSVNVMLGGPMLPVCGVVRATPSLPPNVSTLDYITGLPLLGSASVRSI